MRSKIYKNMTTNEIVFEEDAREYALTKLGLMQDGDLCIKYRGKNGEHTLEQLEMLNEIVEWFFSGNWIEDEIIEDEEIEQYEPDFRRTENDYLYDYWRQENTI